MKKIEDMMFLQVAHGGYPAGTPVVEAEKSSAHYQATAMLGGRQVPTIYCKLAGAEGPATLAIPRFEGLVGDKHPTDPEVVGPFVCTGLGRVAEDKLPPEYAAYIAVGYDYPYAKFDVCVNTVTDSGKVRVELPKHPVVNFREEVEKYLEELKSKGKELEVEYKDYGTY
ncbi:hypothetical protein AGENTSMITH_16 [Bacillus phage vB_BspM_AgentSmith]|nr:hypothetical protein AGENTSMITH_16 [Bacillus phage vB_BspM_AgentSmith]